MMYFLGQAANYRGKILKHLFACGKKADFDALIKHLASRYQVSESNVLLYQNGRTALSCGIKAVVPKRSGEQPGIVITSLTCYAVVEAVKKAGFTPVFADIDPKTLHFNSATLEKALKQHQNIKAVIVQNNLGYPADLDSIQTVTKKHGLILIEDLAHCAGISYANGKEAGTVGDFAILSFGKGKSIDTISGGALVLRATTLTNTDDDQQEARVIKRPKQPTLLPRLSDRMRDRFYPLLGALIRLLYPLHLGKLFTGFLLKTHQIKRSADAELNPSFRLTNWQAKLALKQLIELPKNRPPLREFYFVENRAVVLAELAKKGYIMNDTWYDTPVSPDRYFKKSGYVPAECPVAVEIANHIVNLPTHYPAKSLEPARQIIKKHQYQGVKSE